MKYKNNKGKRLRHTLSVPFIWGMIFPALFWDITLEIYHRVCFPLYGIKYIERSKYIRIDRHKLEYLKFMEKLNCIYCGYVNGLSAYAVQIAGETEKYWCGIKHQSIDGYKHPEHHSDFIAYNDKNAYQEVCNLANK